MQESPDFEALARQVESHPDYRVVRRFQPRDVYSEEPPVRVVQGVVVDTETTGRDARTDELIELAMVAFEYDPTTARVLRVVDAYSGLRDPGLPIPPDASAVNNITDEMVAGQSLDMDRVRAILDASKVIIAHNAGFDRVVCERLDSGFANRPWACSQYDVPWSDVNIRSMKLEFIAYQYGLFYEGHRAEVDCRLLLEVLARETVGFEYNALKAMLTNAKRSSKRIYAMDSRFETKPTLQKRGYRWGAGENGHEKAWYCEVPEEDYEAEIAWLQREVYSGAKFSVVTDTVTASSRYSGRREGTQRHYY